LNKLLPLLAFSVLLLAPVGAQQALAAPGDLYGGESRNSPGNPGGLDIINTADGTEFFVGNDIAVDALSGLAYDSAGRLFGSVPVSGGSTSFLVELDPTTGLVIAGPFPIQDVAGADRKISDLTVDPDDDSLWGMTSSGDFGGGGDLFSIGKDTGVATSEGTLPVSSDGGGLAFSRDGLVLYATDVAQGFFFRINSNDLTLIDSFLPQTPADVIIFDGLGVRCDGDVFGSRSSAIIADGSVYPIDPVGQTIGPVIPTMNGYGDLDFSPSSICGDPVGGTFLPIDSTALLLAVASTPAAWLSSLALVALGIGAYVFTRNPSNMKNIKVILRDYLDRF